MDNKLINFYEKFKSKDDKEDYNKTPIGFNKHHILNNSHILSIGSTGCGKTNSLINYIYLSNGNWYDIIIFCAIVDEYLYSNLKKKLPQITIISDLNLLCDVEEYNYETNGNLPKLLIIDDFINIPKKLILKIKNYLVFGRKRGWTCYLQAQNYVQVDKAIVRNINYFIIYKLNDNITINNIIRNHNINNINKDIIMDMYQYSTNNKGDFFMLDLKSRDPIDFYRHGFLNFLKLKEDQ